MNQIIISMDNDPLISSTDTDLRLSSTLRTKEITIESTSKQLAHSYYTNHPSIEKT